MISQSDAVGVGVEITADGNSVATLDVTDAIDDAIDAHDAEAAAHATQIAAAISTHDALLTAHDVAFDAHRLETDPHPELIDDLPQATVIADTDRYWWVRTASSARGAWIKCGIWCLGITDRIS